jgi:hypothetical protein
LLDGTASANGQTVTMAFRNHNADEKLPPGTAFVTADAVDLEGIPQGDKYVVQLSFSDTMFKAPYLPAGFATPEAYMDYLAVKGNLGIAVFDSANNQWNYEHTGNPVLGAYDGQLVPGHWGVDSIHRVAWEVFNHDIVLTVTPEPGTLALLLAGGFGLVGLYIRRKFKA